MSRCALSRENSWILHAFKSHGYDAWPIISRTEIVLRWFGLSRAFVQHPRVNNHSFAALSREDSECAASTLAWLHQIGGLLFIETAVGSPAESLSSVIFAENFPLVIVFLLLLLLQFAFCRDIMPMIAITRTSRIYFKVQSLLEFRLYSFRGKWDPIDIE